MANSYNWARPGERLIGKTKPLAASSGIIVKRHGMRFRYHPGYTEWGEVLVPPSLWPADYQEPKTTFIFRR